MRFVLPFSFPYFPMPITERRANTSHSTLKWAATTIADFFGRTHILVVQIHCINRLHQNGLHKNPLQISDFIGHLGHSLCAQCKMNAWLFQLKNERNHELEIIINNYGFGVHLHLHMVCARARVRAKHVHIQINKIGGKLKAAQAK